MTGPPPEAGRIEAARHALASAILRWAPDGEMHRPAGLPALAMFRFSAASGPVCGVYEPGVALIVQGSKRVLLGSDTFLYGVHDLLITSLNLPTVAQILEASPDKPYLSLFLRLDVHEIARMMMEGQVPPPRAQAVERAMATGCDRWVQWAARATRSGARSTG